MVTQLPPLGLSDHNCILIKSHVNSIEKPSNKRIYKRDLRESKIRYFGQTITSFDWSEIYDLSDVNEKYNKFNEIVSAMIECHFPNKLTNVRVSDKPWITQSLKSSISKRQKLLHKYGKNSETYKYWRNKVQFALPTKSTTQALVYLLHLILSALDRGQCSIRIVFADFKKGFDLVDHSVVIEELQKLQVNPAIIRWIRSFLSCPRTVG